MQIDRGEFLSFLNWLDAFYRAPEGLQRPTGLLINAHPDFEGIAAWGFDVYLNARQLGASVEIAQADVIRAIQQTDEWRSKHPAPPFPQAPTRDRLLRGQTTQQGLIIHTTQFGAMPWWGACWAWLTAQSRREAAQQLIAIGEKICIVQSALDGKSLYDEPGQFYSPDKFGPLALSVEQHVALVEEARQLGFDGVWLFLDGDDGNHDGAEIAIAQTRLFGPALAASSFRDLNTDVVQIPGWDGTWHKPQDIGGGVSRVGYTREQIARFNAEARAAGAQYVGFEQGTGYMLAGEGGNDYGPGGVMHGYQLVLLEFDDGVFNTDDVWQILGRLQRPYIRPADQPAWDDPNPPFVCGGPSIDGEPPVVRVWEYHMYDGVRGQDPAVIAADKAKFVAMGAVDVC